jgi:hypothetical protein
VGDFEVCQQAFDLRARAEEACEDHAVKVGVVAKDLLGFRV